MKDERSSDRTREEQQFLNRVAAALGRALETAPPERPVRGVAGLPMPGTDADPLQLFLANWRAVGGEADVVKAEEAAGRVAEIARKWGVRRLVRWNDPLLDELGLDEALQKAEISVYVWKAGGSREQAIRELDQADLGVTTVHWVAAEPGSLVLLSGGDTPRAVSLLPPAHLAVVPASRVVPGLTAILREAVERGLSASLNFVTGPSRTADIEMELTVGVHGPGRVYALVVEDR